MPKRQSRKRAELAAEPPAAAAAASQPADGSRQIRSQPEPPNPDSAVEDQLQVLKSIKRDFLNATRMYFAQLKKTILCIICNLGCVRWPL
jgi:hypothetical protein